MGQEREKRGSTGFEFFFRLCCFRLFLPSSGLAIRFRLSNDDAVDVNYAGVSQSVTREAGKRKSEALEKPVDLSGRHRRKKYRRKKTSYPSLCCTQCASKHAVQLTGDTSFVRRHSTHSSKGGRPLAPPPPGAPHEEQQELGRGIDKSSPLSRSLFLCPLSVNPIRLVQSYRDRY